MFSTYKYVFAKNRTIMELEKIGAISNQQADSMRDIAGNHLNKLYGKQMISRNLVNDKYVAVAAAFARIAHYFKGNPSQGLTHMEWIIGANHAMCLSGATEYEADVLVKDMLNMNISVSSRDIFD